MIKIISFGSSVCYIETQNIHIPVIVPVKRRFSAWLI
jgi:hypothetical protein